MKQGITTHILDTSRGVPAAGVTVTLFRTADDSSVQVGRGVTDADGRVQSGLLAPSEYRDGSYQLQFDVAAYFTSLGIASFFPCVRIDFKIDAAQPHYHVPLLLSPYGYSTYRGS